MTLKVVIKGEGLRTDITTEGFLSRVDSKVSLDVLGILEGFVT